MCNFPRFPYLRSKNYLKENRRKIDTHSKLLVLCKKEKKNISTCQQTVLSTNLG